jgi:hypothetical protein
MANRIRPVQVGESDDPDVNKILKAWQDEWWRDANMAGAAAHHPELLKGAHLVMEAFWPGQSEACLTGEPIDNCLTGHLVDMMRIKVANARSCAY